MRIRKLKKLEKTVRSAATSFRGVDIGAYTALSNASDLIKLAICSADDHSKRKRQIPVPLKTLLFSQQHSPKDIK